MNNRTRCTWPGVDRFRLARGMAVTTIIASLIAPDPIALAKFHETADCHDRVTG